MFVNFLYGGRLQRGLMTGQQPVVFRGTPAAWVDTIPLMKVYIDIDGVLLGTQGGKIVLARHAAEFVEFILANFDCDWATGHCVGDIQTVLDYLRPYVSSELLARITTIKPTTWGVLKTDCMSGDFYWVEDAPLQAEIADLARRGMSDRIIEIDVRRRPDDLLFAMEELERVLGR